jgi:hypothetical protein
VLKSDNLAWNSDRGNERRLVYEGPLGPAEATLSVFLAGISSGFSGLDIEKQTTSDDADGWAIVRISYATDQITGQSRPLSDPDYGLISRVWELDANQQNISVLAHRRVDLLAARQASWPTRIAMGAEKYRTSYKKWLSPENDNNNLPEPIPSQYKPSAPPGCTTTELNIANALWDTLIRDPDATCTVSQYALSKSETVASIGNVKASHVNVNRWHTYHALISAEPTLPAAGLIEPAGLEDLIWLRLSPRVRKASGGAWEITQEYWGAVLVTEYAAQQMLWLVYGELIT